MLPELSAIPVSETVPPAMVGVLGLAEQLSVCSRRLRQLIAVHCQDLGLNEAQVALLWACFRSPSSGQSQKELADRLFVSPAHVSGLVEQLRRAGLLTGCRDVHDRRRQRWQLTPAGQTRLRGVLGRLAGWALPCEPPFDSDELLRQLDLLAAALVGLTRAEVLSDSPWLDTCRDEQRGAA